MSKNIEAGAVRSDQALQSGVLNTGAVVFMVVAVSAPLAVVVALLPIAFAYGNGAGLPGAFLIAALALMLFAIGYVKIIPFIKNAGAFYAYISAGLGKELGLAAALLSTMAYFALCASTVAALAFFCRDLFLTITGLDTHWALWGLLSVVAIGFVAYRRITSAAVILGVILITEVLMILALDVAVLFQLGWPAFNLGDFSPSSVFAPGLGIALVYAFNGMAGIEGTAIYQEEAKDRARTIPRATFIAVTLAGAFYILTSWALSSSVGSDQVSAIAGADPGHFVIGQAERFLGGWSGGMFSVLVITSAFAASLGLFNNASRYVYALARDGVMPERFAKTHKVYKSPSSASAVLAVLLAVIIAASAASGLDPLLNVSPALIGIGSVSLMVLIALTAFSIPVFFWRRGEKSFAKTVAPVAGGLIVAFATFMAVTNYSALTGVESPIINNLIWVVPVVALIGFVYAITLKSKRPQIYAQLGKARVEGA
ncbi:APC family permease [Devosia sp. 2618]|uniref:APC family permease n=1 Tax=Devosia sp. 2618 TaxID=3156454 RepID=UPI003390C07F